MTYLGRNIMEARINAGLTQEQLAKYVGVSKATISNYERGVSVPKVIQISRIADATGITVEKLFENVVITAPKDEIRSTPYKLVLTNDPDKLVKLPEYTDEMKAARYSAVYTDEEGSMMIYQAGMKLPVELSEFPQRYIRVYEDHVGEFVIDICSEERKQYYYEKHAIGQIVWENPYI